MRASGLGAAGLADPLDDAGADGRAGAPPSEAAVDALLADAKAKFPEAGWEARSRSNVSPDFSRNLDRFGEFLALVGLISLVVGGVGVANAAQGFVERKRATLAILKALGASGGAVVALALIEFLAVAARRRRHRPRARRGDAVSRRGASPARRCPTRSRRRSIPSELALGALYGLLTALTFSIAPLGRAHDLPVSALFRDLVAEIARGRAGATRLARARRRGARWRRSRSSPARSERSRVVVVVATALALVALRLVASAAMALARRAPRPRSVEARMAIANLHRPGAPTPSVVISLGLGLAVLVALALVDVNLRGQLHPLADGGTPNFYFLDVRSARARARSATSSPTQAPGAAIVEAPMMRGRIVKIGDVAAADFKAKESAQWVLEGDRGVTFADAPPPGLDARRRRNGGPRTITVRRWFRWRPRSPTGSA